MILWDAFSTYFLMTGEKVKTCALVFIALGFLFRQTKWSDHLADGLRRTRTPVLVSSILLIAFAVRLGWVLWSPHVGPSAGTEDYIMLRHARELAAGQGYITTTGEFSADRPIGFAIWLAFLFSIFGENMFLVEFLQVLFGVLTVYLVYRLSRYAFNREVSCLAALLLGLYPTSIFAAKILLEEHIFINLWLLGILLLVSDFQKPRWSKIVWAGILFGIAAHFRTHACAMGFVVLAAWLLLKKWGWQSVLRAMVVQVLIVLWALPWAIRNQIRIGSPVFYSTWVGSTLYYAHNSISDVRYPINPTPEQGGDMDFLTATTEVERNQRGKKAAIDWIKTHPSEFVQKSLGRIVYMLGINREGWTVQDNFHTIREGRAPPSKSLKRHLDKLDNDYYGTIFLLALFGLLVFFLVKDSAVNRQNVWWMLIVLCYYLSIIAITIGYRKYRLPIEPFFCIIAASGLYWTWFGKSAKQ